MRTTVLKARVPGQRAIALDFDSTLWDLSRATAREAAAELGRDEDELLAIISAEWGGIDSLGTPEQVMRWFRRCFVIEGMRPHGLLAGVELALAELEAAGYHIVVMTARPDDVIDHVCEFLAEFRAPVHEVRCGFYDKIAECVKEGIDVLVDDKPETIEQAHAGGIRVLTLRWPYNAEVIDRLGIEHTETWTPDFTERLKTLLGPASPLSAPTI
ncbi:hypothetical protein [Miltoncostaea oceani]|uniref:hypothetical protein n=1 Tax=Miltoncostaea oceani TaxID=2843216 RepID=UPI001C3E7BB5|nr:hypothetical protein [Miltoncostaea oceani]